MLASRFRGLDQMCNRIAVAAAEVRDSDPGVPVFKEDYWDTDTGSYGDI